MPIDPKDTLVIDPTGTVPGFALEIRTLKWDDGVDHK